MTDQTEEPTLTIGDTTYPVSELSDEVKEILRLSSQKLNLSPRSYHRVIKVAQTIADLDNKDTIEPAHVYEALQYRVKV